MKFCIFKNLQPQKQMGKPKNKFALSYKTTEKGLINQLYLKIHGFIEEKKPDSSNKINIKNLPFKFFTNKKGQIIIEYVLLLLVSVVIAKVLVDLASVDPGQGSPIFKYWEHLLRAIGDDIST